MKIKFTPLGAYLSESGVRYHVWAPRAASMNVEITDSDGKSVRTIPLQRQSNGHFSGDDPIGKAGDLYKYRLDGDQAYPDPASRFQPKGVHGASMVVDGPGYAWSDQSWRRPAFRDLVIYELHIGTFTPAGTYLSAIEKLGHVRDLGANAIEIMPLGDFAGERNWGYDGVCLYAPAHAYGSPDDLRALVDAAHGAGLAVILDVVYNHFGPDGNFLAAYAGEYLDETRKTPWGGAIRYGNPDFLPLRQMVVANPEYWMQEFHMDGFRFDATHAIVDESPRHILQEMTDSIHARGGYAIAEDSRNDARILTPANEGGFGFDGVWADDFHHTLRVANTRESEAYLGDFEGSATEIMDTFRHGWLYRGRVSKNSGKLRGSECSHLPPEGFVHCISNHDQIGNQPFGQRLNQLISREAYLASSALLCLTPYTPMLFMGQEWSASAPFIFFTDHNEELGKLITAGRREEFKHFSAFQNPETREKIPDPQSVASFMASKLDWNEATQRESAQTLALYRACLALRGEEKAFRPVSRASWEAQEIGNGVGAWRTRGEERDWLVVFDLVGGHAAALDGGLCRLSNGAKWKQRLATSDIAFGGSGRSGADLPSLRVSFDAPELVVLEANGPAGA